jgi:hypothetical protein
MNQNRLIISQIAGANIVEYELDLYDNVSIPINKSIVDIQNIAERKSDFSKTITLPGTSNNNNIFSNIFNLARSVKNDQTYNFAPDFNPSLKADAILYKNGIVQLQGYLQLTNINVLDDYEIEYEIIIIGKTANLFQDLGEKKLNELDLSAFDHVWNYASMAASWTPSAAIGYYYGLIDLGLSNNQRGYYTKDWKPQIFLKVIIDAIFKDAGYRYSSNFFTSGHYTKLVVPTTQNKLLLTEQQVKDNTFEADRITDSSSVTILSTNPTYVLPFNNIVQDTVPSGYNNTTFKFTAQKNGDYKIGVNAVMELTIAGGGGGLFNYEVLKNGNLIFATPQYIISLSPTDTFRENFSFTDYLEVGDEIEVQLKNIVTTVDVVLKAGSYFNAVINAEIQVGGVMELANCLPSDIKQTDFLLSVINLFNLYIEPSDLDPKRLIIEPRDNFYLNTLVDLTDKVDMSQPIEIKPLAELKFKEYNYEMAADKDAANSDYLLKYSQPYGSAKIGIVNDFVDETFTTKVVFAPTPLLDSKNAGMVFSQIVFRNTSGTRTDGTSKLRLLYAGGLSASFGTNFFHLTDPDGTQHYFNSYPYVGHLDNFNNPTFDVNYYQPKEIAYTTNTQVNYTPNNLYNLYHRKGLLEITDKDSKTVTLFAHLNENEINKLSFRNYYFIDKQYYRLYEIDFDSNSEEPAKLTLLKLAVAPDFNDEPIIINGGGGGETTFAQPPNPNGNDFTKDSDLNVSGQDNLVRGEANLINSDNNLINGRLNSVFGGGNNQLNNNNGTYLNTNNYQSVRDGEVVINNIAQPLLVSRVLTVSELRNLHTTPIQLLASVDGYWTEVYDAYITMFFEAATPVAYNNHKLHLQYNGDGTHLLNFDNRITTVTTATKQRGVNVTDLPFKNLAVQIHSAGNLGTSGNGKALIELEYRLHRIIS